MGLISFDRVIFILLSILFVEKNCTANCTNKSFFFERKSYKFLCGLDLPSGKGKDRGVELLIPCHSVLEKFWEK